MMEAKTIRGMIAEKLALWKKQTKVVTHKRQQRWNHKGWMELTFNALKEHKEGNKGGNKSDQKDKEEKEDARPADLEHKTTAQIMQAKNTLTYIIKIHRKQEERRRAEKLRQILARILARLINKKWQRKKQWKRYRNEEKPGESVIKRGATNKIRTAWKEYQKLGRTTQKTSERNLRNWARRDRVGWRTRTTLRRILAAPISTHNKAHIKHKA